VQRFDQDYRSILRAEFERRARQNARYSLRAFARQIGLPSTRLSDVLLHKQGLSKKTAYLIAKKLGYSARESEFFALLVEAESGRSRLARETARKQLREFQEDAPLQVGLDAFRVVADWHHFAILELMSDPTFVFTSKSIAARLGIHTTEVELAITRLKTAGLVKDVHGKPTRQADFVATPSEIPSAAIKSYHEQILKKSIQALHLQAVSNRDFSSINLRISETQLDEAKNLICKFRRDFMRLLEKAPARNKLYNLSIQFFSLEQEIKS
jgi:uncharacterized protein (TIGR02147 family)